MRPAAETALGVDVGGTRIRVARIDRDGRILQRLVEPVRSDRAGFQAQLARLIGEMRAPSDAGVGIGIPGRVDGRSNGILSAGYLDIAGLDLAGLVVDATGLPCRIENDATMALIAEMRMRPGGSEGLVAMFTIGTGIGGAMLQDGRPWYGGGLSGQFGHIVVAEDGPPCNCGRTGCVETFSSGTALGQLIAQGGLPEATRAGDLLARAEGGEANAADLLERWARPLLRAIETIVSVSDPRLVLVGGGLGAEMTRALARLSSRSPWFPLPIEAAVLGDDAGVVGAGLSGLDARAAGEGGPAT